MAELNFLQIISQRPGASHTASEILQQPALWQQVFENISAQKEEINRFLTTALKNSDYIIFTGAGTSAFIGLSLHGVYFRKTGLLSQAVATTDIVSHPGDYFDKAHRPFIVSFARSGNSPESIAALECADRHAKSCYHLIITCDGGGALASFKSVGKGETFVYTLPVAANDKGLAMTSSYTSMLLTAILMLYLDDLKEAQSQIELLTTMTQKVLNKEAKSLYELAGSGFTRAVFLGSGPIYGTATEAHLKLQELTGGRIICKADSYLGFRHGPKAVLNSRTLVVFFLSNNEKVRRYELDLIRTIQKEAAIAKETANDSGHSLQGLLIAADSHALDNLAIEEPGADDCFHRILLADGSDRSLHDDYWPVGAIVCGQLLALFASLQLGIAPDTPSKSGAISRVVQGVTIYQDIADAPDSSEASGKTKANEIDQLSAAGTSSKATMP